MGVTRRLRHFDDPTLQPFFIAAAIGAVLIAGGIGCMIAQFYVSIRDREKLRDTTGDPWNARTLEWSTSSPPPDYNFAFTPIVHDTDAWWDMKARGYERPTDGFHPIHMPKNTATGVIIAGLAVGFGFGMIWYIWWLAAICFAGMLATAIGHTFNYNRDYHVPVDEVIRTESARTKLLAAQG
jgi:cytochrome o ubiquinol oxidase subunit 1